MRPGKPLRCVDCAVKVATDQQIQLARQEGPHFAKSLATGARMAQEYENRDGEWYEKWRKGMERAMERESATDRHPSATMRETSHKEA